MDEPIPLDLLCDMAWRITAKEDGHTVRFGAWIQCVHQADHMIREAYRVRERSALTAEIAEQDWQKQWQTRKAIIEPMLTPQERKATRVEFERGCQIITGIKKRREAVLKVDMVWTRFMWDENEVGLADWGDAQKKGWRLDDLAGAYLQYQSKPKHLLRKPYEKSGRFKPKYQKQKKKVLGGVKKTLAGQGNKKSPKRGGISRA